MGTRLKEITYLTSKNLKKFDIVLPKKYTTTFENIAKRLNVDLSSNEFVQNDINEDIEHLNTIVEKTNNNLNIIQKSTKNAQKAIKDKDEKFLIEINNELKRMEEEIITLQRELFSDPLTDALNRKWFVEKYLKDNCFQNEGFIAFIDLNNFKNINDNYGHLVGDQVLKYLVKFLKNELKFPGLDIVRYAGDEFLILFNKEKVTIPNVEKIVSEAQIKLSNQKLKSSKIDELKFSFSNGISAFHKGDDADGIIDLVDNLMYKNKNCAL